MRIRFSTRAVTVVSALLVLVAGCSHEIDGPAPAVTGPVNPHLVCNAQLTTRLDVSGSGFSPLPVDTATEPARLELPAVSLLRTAGLDGAPVVGATPVVLPDSSTMPATSQVHWTSQTSMAFDVTPSLMLADGVFTLGVKNANGHETTFPAALVAVPPPTLTRIEPMAICDAQAAVMLMVIGTGFLNVDGTLPEVTFTGPVTKTYTPTAATGCTTLPAPATETQSCTSLSVTIPMGDLPPGVYSVVVKNPDPAGCSTSESISVEVVPPPDVTSAMPSRVCTGGGTIGLQGTGFRPGADVTVGTLDASSVDVAAGGMSATARFGAGLDPGTYDVTLTNPEGCSDTLTMAIQVVEGPIVFWVDPNVVYNGITTQITVYASGVTAMSGIDMLQIIPSGGGAPIVLTHTVDARGRIQAIVPSGTAPGDYDVQIDSAGCSAVLPRGLHVTDTLSLTLDRVEPPFGWRDEATPVTIYGAGMTSTPRVYLNPDMPAPGTVATLLRSVGFVSADRITALVPPGLPAGVYDVLVVNPTGEVGLIDQGFTVTMDAPPVIETVSPGEVDSGGTRNIDVTGSGFATPTATWLCSDGMTPAGSVMASTATTATVTLDTGTLAAGTVCVLRLTNPDGTYGEYSAVAITTPASNIQMFRAGPSMTSARRAPAVVAGRVTSAARFLYAIGGDDGTAAGALTTSEAAPVDPFGALGTWFEQPNALPAALTLARAQRIGRFIYVVGGDGGTGAVADVRRAEILDPLLAPQVTDIGARRGMGMGLGAGIWTFRVSAIFPAGDEQNPGGESLPSDPLPVELPMGLPDTLLITIDWSEVTGASGYRIYRSPTAGATTEELVAEVGAATRSYEDTGAAPMAMRTPLPLGSHGTWKAMPSLGTPRAAPGLGYATDPVTPNIHYLYAIGGRNGAGAPVGTYEYLTITVTGPRTHTVAAAWTAGGGALPIARAELAAFSVDNFAATRLAAPRTFIYAGAGLGTGATAVSDVDAAEVQAGGALGAWIAVDAARNTAGYAYAAGNNFLYMFGGGPMASTACISAEICGPGLTCAAGPPDPPDLRNWNAEGINLVAARYLPGSTVESSFIFVVGGSGGTGALATTEQTVL